MNEHITSTTQMPLGGWCWVCRCSSGVAGFVNQQQAQDSADAHLRKADRAGQ